MDAVHGLRLEQTFANLLRGADQQGPQLIDRLCLGLDRAAAGKRDSPHGFGCAGLFLRDSPGLARKDAGPPFVDAGALAGRLLGKWGNVALIVKHELPIALGTGGDLVATIREGLIGSRHVKDITATNVRMAIRVLTGRKPYLARLAAHGSVRYHLDLRVAGPVSDVHRQEARDRLKTRFGMSDEDVDALIQSVCSSSTPPQ